MATIDAGAAVAAREYQWYDLIEMSGPEGSRWMEDYSRFLPITREMTASLALLRKGGVEAGGRMLDEARSAIGEARPDDPTVLAILERWYQGAVGYYHYVRGRHDDADRAMVRADEVVAEALVGHPFLMAVADQAVELRFHRARIARNRGRWREMEDHLQVARAMREGKLPYYVLRDGTTVGIGSLKEFLDAIPVPEEDRPLVPRLQDDGERRLGTDLFIREILRIPGMVIQHP